jgi:hypothetical protein
VEPNAYGAPGVAEGPIATLSTEQFRFKQDCTVHLLRLFSGGWLNKTAPHTSIAFGKGAQLLDVWQLAGTPAQAKQARVDTGGWFALYSGELANPALFINRGRPRRSNRVLYGPGLCEYRRQAGIVC